MDNNMYYANLRELLDAGHTPEELAQQFTEALNKASAEAKEAEKRASMHEFFEDLTMSWNTDLEDYIELYGSKNQTHEIFTIDEVEDIVNAKIYGKKPNKVCACEEHANKSACDSAKPAAEHTAESSKNNSKVVVNIPGYEPIEFTEEELDAAWQRTSDFLQKLFNDLN